MINLRTLITSCAVLLLYLPLCPAVDWPQRRGPAHDGISIENRWTSDWPVEGPKILWKTNVGLGYPSSVVGGGMLYTVGQQGEKNVVQALDAVTGKEVWRYEFSEALNAKMYEGGPNSTPTLSEGVLYNASRTGKVYALDAKTGALKWETALKKAITAKTSDWGVSGAPVVEGGMLLINYGPCGVALNKADGKLVWSSKVEKGNEMSFVSPVVTELGGQRVVLLHLQKYLAAVSLKDGTELWRNKFGKGYETHCSDPVVLPGNRVFISSGDDGGELLEVKGSEVTRLWKNMNLATFTGTAVYIDGFLYGLDSSGYNKAEQELRCIDVKDGSVRWGIKGFGQGSVIAAGNRLVVQGEKGEVAVVKVSPEKGEVLARSQVLGGTSWTQPTLADGLLYSRNSKGDMVCLDLRVPASATAK